MVGELVRSGGGIESILMLLEVSEILLELFIIGNNLYYTLTAGYGLASH